MPRSAIVVGIGGTGAKCVEAVCHLAVSGNAPDTIYPIIIDQDRDNGNVQQCVNTLRAYSDIRNKANKPRNWFFKPIIEIEDKLLPLTPQDDRSNYQAAIGMPSMSPIEQKVIESLFLPCQLEETLDLGYKKRAHMGSVLISQMLLREKEKDASDKGLNFFVEKLKTQQDAVVIIYGSLFGGTGASAMCEIGNYFKHAMPNSLIIGVFMTPYFIIGRAVEGEKDANLVKSDADMLATKIALQMYKDQIENSFHEVCVIGSETKYLSNEFVTLNAQYGGKTQINPAHVFELLAASVSIYDFRQKKEGDTPVDQNIKVRYHIHSIESTRSSPAIIFAIDSKYPGKDQEKGAVFARLFDVRGIVTGRDLARMFVKVENNDVTKWWERQPWFHPQFRERLLNWAKRHYDWWMEMSPTEWNKHRWEVFSLDLKNQIDEYSMSAYISQYFGKKNTNDLANLFETIDILKQKRVKEITWASK